MAPKQPDQSPHKESTQGESSQGQAAPDGAPWRRDHRRRWHGPWQGDSPPWAGPDWRRRRRIFLLRFLGFLLLVILLVSGGMAALAFHLTNYMGGAQQMAGLVWIGGCGLALTLPLLALAIMARAFRSYALPLADIMSAADQVAAGDLSVRLEPRGSREFQRLTTSFNRMTGELERTDQQRRNLTADIAHELRTPLHIIQGNLEGVLDGVYSPTVEHIEATLEETQLLARLVEDLRILSLAEAGELPLSRTTVDIEELLTDVVTSFSSQAETNGIELQMHTATPSAALLTNGDAGRLDQVFSNLVANALRHTPAGGTVTLIAKEHADTVHVTLRDTGCGIAPDDLPFVFDRFWKGDSARTHSSGSGSGLGLAIARQLIEAHGGEIAVASEVGEGTTFTVQIPRG